MKKLVLSSAVLATFLSCSALATTPTAPGTWVGPYKFIGSSTSRTCFFPEGAKAFLTTGSGTTQGTSTTYDVGTLRLDGFKDSNTTNPQWQNPIAVRVVIWDQTPSLVQIFYDGGSFQGGSGYNGNGTILWTQNSTTTCSLELESLVYNQGSGLTN